MPIQSVQIKNPDGSTSQNEVGSKSYNRRLSEGGSVVGGTGGQGGSDNGGDGADGESGKDGTYVTKSLT